MSWKQKLSGQGRRVKNPLLALPEREVCFCGSRKIFALCCRDNLKPEIPAEKHWKFQRLADLHTAEIAERKKESREKVR